MLARESGASSLQQRNPGHQPPPLEPPEARLHLASRLSLSGGGIYEIRIVLVPPTYALRSAEPELQLPCLSQR